MGPTLTFREYRGSKPLSPTVSGMKEHVEAVVMPTKREPGLAYLFNGSNMCFINSVLQALAQIPGFVNKFIDDSILETMHPITSHTADGRLTLGVGEVFKKLWLGRKRLVNAGEVKALLSQAHGGYDNDDQQDAHEFFLDLMLSILLSTRMFPFNEEIWKVPLVRRFPGVRAADRRYRNALLSSKGVSPLAEDFVGQLRITYMCNQCHRVKHTYENFLTLELELPSKGTSRSLEHLFKENISNPSFHPSMRCGFCEKASYRRKAFDRLPRVFVIQLRRYGRSPVNRNRYVKLFNYVDFPLVLNMLPFLKDATDGHFIYDLRGVVQHMGPDTDCGHYTAKIRYLYRTDDDDWRVMDDHRAIDVLDDPLSELNPKVRPSMRASIFTPYLLFYVAKPYEDKLYKLSGEDILQHPVIQAGASEVDFIMPAAIRYMHEIRESGIEYLKKITDYAPRIRTAWIPGDQITQKHVLYHTAICELFPRLKPVPRRPALPQLRQILPLDEECVEEVEWTDEIVIERRTEGGQDWHFEETLPPSVSKSNSSQDIPSRNASEESAKKSSRTSKRALRLRGGGKTSESSKSRRSRSTKTKAPALSRQDSETSVLSRILESTEWEFTPETLKRDAEDASVLNREATGCPATSWLECAADAIQDPDLLDWSKDIAKTIAYMNDMMDECGEDGGQSKKRERSRAGMAKKLKLPPCPKKRLAGEQTTVTRTVLGDLSVTLERKPELVEYVLDQLVDMIKFYQEERELLRQKRYDAWHRYLNQVQNDCNRKEELDVLKMLDVLNKKVDDPPLDLEYVWETYQESEKSLQDRASGLDELNRSIANKEVAIEKLANEEDWLREQQAAYDTPESQARFMKYWMKQARKRGTQAVLDFKQSSLQRYLSERKQVIDTLGLIKKIDNNFSKKNKGFNWAIDAMGAHLTNCKDPKKSFLFQKLFPNLKDGSLPQYPSIARYWEMVGQEARIFEVDLQNILKEVKGIVPSLKALFPASDGGGVEVLDEFNDDLEETQKKDLIFYPTSALEK